MDPISRNLSEDITRHLGMLAGTLEMLRVTKDPQIVAWLLRLVDSHGMHASMKAKTLLGRVAPEYRGDDDS